MKATGAAHSLRVYAGLNLSLGLLMVFLTWKIAPPTLNGFILLLALATVLAENMAVDLPGGGSTSLSVPLSLAALVLLGPVSGAVIAAISGFNVSDIRRHRPPVVFIFNFGQLLVSTIAGGLVYLLLGGRILAGPVGGEPLAFGAAEFPHMLLPLAGLAATGTAANLLLVSGGICLKTGVSFAQVWRANTSWVLPMQLVLGSLGFAMAQILAIAPVGFVLFLFPLVVSRQMYQRYMGLRDAYRDTVRSLVAAIEAKDPYTRGHSERVASYAMAIAKQMRLPDAALERLEFAALLHDLGKVGISGRVLMKESPLTSTEWDEIKRHPAIGARIVERVPYLADIVGAVRSHHERFDGRGYGEGLSQGAVPLEARILAVADSYDAMTSERPYRPALSVKEALAEVKDGRGTQFDPDVADAFLAWLAPDAADMPDSTVGAGMAPRMAGDDA